jgi:general secretion pathway protein N
MKTIIPLSLAICLFGSAAIAQETIGESIGAATGAGLDGAGLDGATGRPGLAALQRQDPPGQDPRQREPAQSGKEKQALEPAAARANPLWAVPLETLRATRERPVFSETRRPPVVAMAEPIRIAEVVPESEPAEPEPPSLTLIGTVVGLDTNVGIFLDAAEHEIVRLRIGEAGSGWTLRRVDPKATTLEKDNREVTLSLPAPDTLSGSDGGGTDPFAQPPPGTPPNIFGASGRSHPNGGPNSKRSPTSSSGRFNGSGPPGRIPNNQEF